MLKKPLIQVPFKYGSIASGLLIILFTVLFLAGRHPLFIPIFMDIRFIMLPLFMFFAMKDFRDNHNEKILHFWQGLSIGFITFASIAVLVSAYIWIMAEVSSDFLSEYISSRMEVLNTYKEQLLEGTNEAFVKGQLESLPLTQPINLAVDYFWKTIGIGIVLNIILAVVLRRQPNLT